MRIAIVVALGLWIAAAVFSVGALEERDPNWLRLERALPLPPSQLAALRANSFELHQTVRLSGLLLSQASFDSVLDGKSCVYERRVPLAGGPAQVQVGKVTLETGTNGMPLDLERAVVYGELATRPSTPPLAINRLCGGDEVLAVGTIEWHFEHRLPVLTAPLTVARGGEAALVGRRAARRRRATVGGGALVLLGAAALVVGRRNRSRAT